MSALIRRIYHNPCKILYPYLHSGMTVLDAGCGDGYFTLPMAKYLGKRGKIIAVDKDKQTIEQLNKKIEKKGLKEIIETRVSTEAGDSPCTGKGRFCTGL